LVQKKKLNLGCGDVIKSGWVNVNYEKTVGVDVVHDLNVFPYPFKDGFYDEILMDNVLEHLYEPHRVISECYRILCSGGKLKIIVPYKFRNMTILHYSFFDEYSLDNFISPYGDHSISGRQEISLFKETKPVRVKKLFRFYSSYRRQMGRTYGLISTNPLLCRFFGIKKSIEWNLEKL